MEMESKDWIGIIGSAISTIVAFFVGQSGILKKYFTNRLSQLERRQKREEAEVERTKAENVELHKLVDELTQKVSGLERDLANANLKVQFILAYMEKNQPEGDEFVKQLKELTKN